MSDRTLPKGEKTDFDFLHGAWRVRNRRLKARWSGCDDWHEFFGESRCAAHLGGTANVEEIAFPSEGLAGLTLRLFDGEKSRWSIYWASSAGGALFPPVCGGFTGDHGVFFGKDEDAGQPVHVRFFWARLGPETAQWQQAFSRDGLIWETNWIMDYKRLAP